MRRWKDTLKALELSHTIGLMLYAGQLDTKANNIEILRLLREPRRREASLSRLALCLVTISSNRS